jgi:outer membrane cobalamin receptor
LPWFSARSSVTVQQAVDESTHLEFPYKPRWSFLGTIGVKPRPHVLLSLEQSYVGERRFSGTSAANRGDERLKPWYPTALRADWQFGCGWTLFAREENLFERPGWDFPGYPMAGRQYFLGISAGERLL